MPAWLLLAAPLTLPLMLLPLIFPLAGCATPEQQLAAASKIEKSDDQFLPFRQYTSGTLKSPLIFGPGTTNTEIELVGQVDRKAGTRVFGAYVTLIYHDEPLRSYFEARTASAVLLHFRNHVHQSSGCHGNSSYCSRKEVVIVDIPEAELRNAGTAGYPIKLFAKLGPGVPVTIPQQLIAALFTAVDAGEKQVASAQQKP